MSVSRSSIDESRSEIRKPGSSKRTLLPFEVRPGIYIGNKGADYLTSLSPAESRQPLLVSSPPHLPLHPLPRGTKKSNVEDSLSDFEEGGNHPLGLFSKRSLECSNPKTEMSVNHLTGEISEEIRYRFDPYYEQHVPIRCMRNTCAACSIWNGRNIARAIWLSQPDYVLTLTAVGNDFRTIHRRLNKFFSKVREIYPTLEYTWQAEPNHRRTGNHVLLYLHSKDPSISRAVIGKAWRRHFELEKVYLYSNPSFYGYQMKSLVDPQWADEFRALNGSTPHRQHLIHASHGFWRDGRGGQRLTQIGIGGPKRTEKVGDKVLFSTFGPGSQVQMNMNTTLQIVFDQGLEVADREVGSTLRWFHDHIRDTVFQALEPHL